jgi:hypothetical protein
MLEIDLTREQLLSLADAAKGMPVSPRTVARWATVGVRGVRLATVFLGGRRCTSREAIARFVEDITELRDGANAEIEAMPVQRAEHLAAMRRLAARGIC